MFIGCAIFYSQGAKIIEQSVMIWKYGTKINTVFTVIEEVSIQQL